MAGAVRTVYAYSLAFNPVKAKIGREDCNMKLLGVSELADGSLNFTFGVAPEGLTSSGNILDSHLAAQPQLASSQLPVRLPSAFKKKSPISVSTKRREVPTRSKELLTKEAESPKPGAFAKDVLPVDIKKEEIHVLDRVEKNTSRLSQDAVSSQTSSSRKTPGKSLPTRLKSKFVKHSPVPASSEAIHTTVDPSSKSSVAKAGTKRTPRKVTSQITTSGISVSTRGDRALDISVQTGRVTAETLREHVALDTQTSAKTTSDAVAEGTDANNASVSDDSEELAALNIQGLSVSISSQNSDEKGEEIQLGTKDASVEALSLYKLADLKSMAKSRGLRGYSKLKKVELIELLSKPEI